MAAGAAAAAAAAAATTTKEAAAAAAAAAATTTNNNINNTKTTTEIFFFFFYLGPSFKLYMLRDAIRHETYGVIVDAFDLHAKSRWHEVTRTFVMVDYISDCANSSNIMANMNILSICSSGSS